MRAGGFDKPQKRSRFIANSDYVINQEFSFINHYFRSAYGNAIQEAPPLSSSQRSEGSCTTDDALYPQAPTDLASVEPRLLHYETHLHPRELQGRLPTDMEPHGILAESAWNRHLAR